MPETRPYKYLLALFYLAVVVYIGYYVERHETLPLFLAYFTIFLVYVAVITDTRNADVNFWIAASLLFRISLLFAVPALSDDFYRFIWDGRLLAAGENPFTHVPSWYMEPSHNLPGLDAELFDKLNSQHRYSSYPPVCQAVYWTSAVLSPQNIQGSVIVMKVILLLFEVGAFVIIQKLLKQFNLPAQRGLVYALNPLVILEIVGNLHFEGMMIFFLLMAISLLVARRSLVVSAAFFALSVCTKLIPLLFLPAFYHPLGRKRALTYWIATGLIVVVLYIPLLQSGILQGYSTSLGYYFQRFEFNASIYYVVRAAGNVIAGFNIIAYAGPALALVAAGLILHLSLNSRVMRASRTFDPQVLGMMAFCLLTYFLSTTILHPWYIITLLALSLFTSYRFPIVWTALIFFSYDGYTETGYNENLWLVAAEYSILFLFVFFEALWHPETRRY